MGKAAASRQTTTKKPEIDRGMEQFAAATAAKQQFLAATMNMSWRLAVTIVVPVVGGVKLDDHFHSAPSWTITGLFIAVAAGSSAVWSTIKQVNKQQAEEDTNLKSKEKITRV